MIIKYILLGLAGLIVLLLLVVIIRALCFNPKKQEEASNDTIEFDKERAVKNLQKLVTFKTISNFDSKLEDDNEFENLVNELPNLFPEVFKQCTLTKFEGRGLLFHLKGTVGGDPGIFMAHYDVVPVNEEEWTKPAFDGLLEDGILWGRGTLDTKVTFSGVLSAAEELLEKGFKPKRDLYFAFSGCEEVNGPGAPAMVKYFKEKGITPSFVIDEGGAVVDNIFPGVKEPCGLIGIAEKGMINLTLECKSNGGHASSPKPHTPVGKLSTACHKMEANPFKMHITKPVAEMFDTLGRKSTFVYKLIFSNLWLFKGVLNMICKKSGGELNALVRTTVAFTQMEGSSAPNVIPPVANMTANIRINPEDSIKKVIDYATKVVNDPDIKIGHYLEEEPSIISRTDVEGWYLVKNAVLNTWKGCIVSPYLMVQCSDSRHYGEISDRVYRFSAMDLRADERCTIHGNDEHIRVETIERSVEFFIRVMREC